MSSSTHVIKIAGELSLTVKQIIACAELLDEGGTVPFVARYRKEATGGMDEVQIAAVRDRLAQLRDLDKRREAILKSIREQEKLTPELEAKLMAAETSAELEDIYLPYKPKRRTRATIAREKGLEPLALRIFEQGNFSPEDEAEAFVSEEKGVAGTDEAIAGALDIIAEMISENGDARAEMRTLFIKKGIIATRLITGKEKEAEKFKDYFERSEPVGEIPSHRLLAMRRGEKEGFLLLDVEPPQEEALDLLERRFVKASNAASRLVKKAAEDAYKRLLRSSIETETRLTAKEKADEEAIRVFTQNLKELLMASPLGRKNVMAIDPGFRTGCKVAVLDRQGKLLHHDVIYPEFGARRTDALHTVLALSAKYDIEAIAIGNGTAGRETETFIRSVGLPATIAIVMVNESGASIYSASDVAREEFPDLDLTVRGAVSIGRRLMDPLSELVKIDPKSIGVGQYQHDVDQNRLKQSLDDTVISCVNAVGVELNTAGKQLLTYVSGLGPKTAQNIVEYRNQNGPFATRNDLKKVPGIGDKAFEQCAGFLRIQNGKNPLDASAVHPERYAVVEKMAGDLGVKIDKLIGNKEAVTQIKPASYVTGELGLPTLKDIMDELLKPGRDPRESFEQFNFTEGVNDMNDLKVGMKLPGIITNVTNFGAFVDIGVHQDGLVHVSHLADKFVSDPYSVVKVQQKVQVTVLEADVQRKRIALSMKADPFGAPAPGGKKAAPAKEPEPEGDLQAKLAMLKGKFK